MVFKWSSIFGLLGAGGGRETKMVKKWSSFGWPPKHMVIETIWFSMGVKGMVYDTIW